MGTRFLAGHCVRCRGRNRAPYAARRRPYRPQACSICSSPNGATKGARRFGRLLNRSSTSSPVVKSSATSSFISARPMTPTWSRSIASATRSDPSVVRPLADCAGRRGKQPRDPPAARVAARLRRRGTPVGRAAETLAQSRGPPHGDRSAAGVRRPRSAAGAGVDARRRGSAGPARIDPRDRADRHGCRPTPCSSTALVGGQRVTRHDPAAADWTCATTRPIPLLCYVLESHVAARQAGDACTCRSSRRWAA